MMEQFEITFSGSAQHPGGQRKKYINENSAQRCIAAMIVFIILLRFQSNRRWWFSDVC